MMPSSRTPEGEPLRCDVCGIASAVESSTPPGDAVCPNCGSHLWITTGESPTKLAIRSFVRELQLLVSARDSTAYTVGFLVTGLRRCLAAHGASLWVTPKQRLFWMPKPFLVRSDGRPAAPDFACEVISTGVSVVRSATDEGFSFLHLGVPISSDGCILGAIEIVQRDVRDNSVQCGYVRFISQMGKVVAPLAAELSGG